MQLIVGLGNPGAKYEHTRHNIGFMVVDKLVGNKATWTFEKKFSAEIVKMTDDFIVAKPQAYMNRSGLSVATLSQFYKIPADSIWVVHDDIDLPLGKLRIRKGGASAGHNGVDSIITLLGSESFVRFRLGIGRGKLNQKKHADQNLHRREIERFVVSPFTSQYESKEAGRLIKHTVNALKTAIGKGLEKAMTQYN